MILEKYKINVKSRKKSKKTEIYNFQKVSSIFADHGFCTIKLQDDWQGADFIAQNMFSEIDRKIDFLKIQLKSTFEFNTKYFNKEIYICFPIGDNISDKWYLYNHDQTLDDAINNAKGKQKNALESIKNKQLQKYHFTKKMLTKSWMKFLGQYEIY